MINGNIAAVDCVNVTFKCVKNFIRLPFKNGLFPSYALHSHPRPAINEAKGRTDVYQPSKHTKAVEMY